MSTDPELDEYDVPPSRQEERVLAWVSEAMELRYGAAGDDEGSLDGILDVNSPRDVLAALRRVRIRADRVEHLLVNARRAKRRAKSTRDRVAFEAGNRFGASLVAEGQRRVEFQSAEERRQIANMESIEERRLAHQAERLVDITVEAYDAINTIHWGLDAIRKDLRSALNAFQFENSLER